MTAKGAKTGLGSTYKIKGFKKATRAQLKPYLKNVRTKVIPKIKTQMKQKERGAERARSYKLF
jgi:hypothetical protein